MGYFDEENEDNAYSLTDAEAINGYPQRRRSLLRACEILLSRRDELAGIVEKATASLVANSGSVFNWPIGFSGLEV